MGKQSGQISMATRELIINNFKEGLSVQQIASIVKRSHSTVHDIIKPDQTNGKYFQHPKDDGYYRK